LVFGFVVVVVLVLMSVCVGGARLVRTRRGVVCGKKKPAAKSTTRPATHSPLPSQRQTNAAAAARALRLDANSSSTARQCVRSESAPTGHTATHWPHEMHADAVMSLSVLMCWVWFGFDAFD
jgi:hypothetical protein